MADAMMINVPKKPKKRKRVELTLSSEEREARIRVLREEIDGLIEYYHEGCSRMNRLINVDSVKIGNCSSNQMIACLMEESSLPLSKLVDWIREKEGCMSMTAAAVKNTAIAVGQRWCYGVHNLNADVLEDESPSCLWCWETRDLKLLPKSCRGALKIRRTCRKKIHERINAVSAVITELMKPQSTSDGVQKVLKASERLSKVLNEAGIRLLVEKMEQKNGDVSEKEAKREEKEDAKHLEKNKRETQKEKARMEREILKEKLHNEKEQKRLQDEAEKEGKRRENEIKKQLKKQQEEAGRREKEENEHKKQLALRKQASILEQFLKKGKNNSPLQVDQSTVKESATNISLKRQESDSVIQSMDYALSLKCEFDANQLWKDHLDSWHQLDHSRSGRHWGVRRAPKTVLFKELKLTSKGEDDAVVDKFETDLKHNANSDGSVSGSQKLSRCKQLLQFDKSHRPAFYGYWPKKSEVVRARCPLAKDPELDYEIDSDEEWEEEEPGESLSDCEKEEDDENLSIADDEDESEDGFFVPDGYLSENEGVEVDRMDHGEITEDAKTSPNCDQMETEELSILFKQFKHLNTLTEHALRKNKPVLIANLMHEKSKSTSETEYMCLQALCIRAFPVGPSVEIIAGYDMQEEIQEDCPSSSKSSVLPVASGPTTISDSDLPEFVSVIQSCPHGINKVVENLRLKFPNIPKCQLGSKVREISVFADNRWQVKKEILNKFGLSSSPEKTTKGTKSITAFFSKRCLPPSGKTQSHNQDSPQPMDKTSPAAEQVSSTYNNG
ncbi:chromatin assembly factor 1 subunit FAS1-like [Bidens hawaiensis]|uniref:chromatin assembly factor 1 subunit FAS1-like n=1 Tax=Bidens hawaiensis TaxID=980011 RepID=UPI00404B7DEA